MKLVGTLLKFSIPKSVSLKPILSVGYSAPTKDSPRSRKSYGEFEGQIERRVTEGDKDDYVLISVIASADVDLIFGQTEIMADLAASGLLQA